MCINNNINKQGNLEWITTKKFYNLVMYNISPNSSNLYKVTDMGLILVRVLKNGVIIETGVYQQNYTGVDRIHSLEGKSYCDFKSHV